MSTYLSHGAVMARVLSEMEAKGASWSEILPEHVWMALTKLSDSSDDALAKLMNLGPAKHVLFLKEISGLRRWFAEKGMNTKQIRRSLRRQLGRGTGANSRIHRNPESVARFKDAVILAENEGCFKANATHLARAIFEKPPVHLCAVLGLTRQAPSNRINKLVRFGRDITAQAAKGELDPVIGRRKELLAVIRVLGRKRKRNALLVGDAGVGKTCVVEGLAHKIAALDGPPSLKNKRIIEISMTALTAGTGRRGDTEGRIRTILGIAESEPDLLLFMDEVHTLMAKLGGIDPADMFKPALARGKLTMIGATTTAEYDRYIANDEAIARRFEVIRVEEPSRAEAIEIVAGVKTVLESHHDVSITPEAVEAAVDLSIRHLPERRLPDKALDLMDQACTEKVVGCLTVPVTPEPTPTDLATIIDQQPEKKRVDRSDIAKALSRQTGIPYDLLAAADRERIKSLKGFLERRIVGQKTAVETICRVLKTAFYGLREPNRPLASFLFSGPSGVGKTETAKTLAEFLFGDAGRMVRVDLSEYTERHQIARLIGAPPGYVGSESPGMLTAAMRRRPASVVLFDEIEKAHPDVLNILLQILDEGILTDGQGKKAHFHEAVVILTSNIIPESSHGPAIGFAVGGQDNSPNDVRNRLVRALSRHLRPELLGRIRSVVPFNPLDADALMAIADRAFQNMADRLREQNVRLPEDFKEHIRQVFQTGAVNARDIEHQMASAVGQWLETHSVSVGAESSASPTQAGDASHSPTGDILYSIMPRVRTMDAALVVIDLVQSTQLVCSEGDTVFSNLIGNIFSHFRGYAGDDRLLFMKCTGDGFFAVYRGVCDAAGVALSFLDENVLDGKRFRIALHRGTMKIGPGGDPLGSEVHRVFRMESVQEKDRADQDAKRSLLPAENRIVTSANTLDEMEPAQSKRFQPAGTFHLKGFDEPIALWAASKKKGDNPPNAR